MGQQSQGQPNQIPWPSPSQATPHPTARWEQVLRLLPAHSGLTSPTPRPTATCGAPLWATATAPVSRSGCPPAHLSPRERDLHGWEPGSSEVAPTFSQADCSVHPKQGVWDPCVPSIRPHLQEATCAHQAPRPRAGGATPADSVLGIPALPHADPRQAPAGGQGGVGSGHPALGSLLPSLHLPAPTPTSHTPSRPGPESQGAHLLVPDEETS